MHTLVQIKSTVYYLNSNTMTLSWGDNCLNKLYLLSEVFLSERVVEYRLFDIYKLHINVILKGCKCHCGYCNSVWSWRSWIARVLVGNWYVGWVTDKYMEQNTFRDLITCQPAIYWTCYASQNFITVFTKSPPLSVLKPDNFSSPSNAVFKAHLVTRLV